MSPDSYNGAPSPGIGLQTTTPNHAAESMGLTGPYTLIVGLGQTGSSCARFLAGLGLPFRVTDTRLEPPELAAFRARFPLAPLYLGGFDPELFAAADQLIVSPGVALDEPAVQVAMRRGVSVLGDIELFARHARAPIVAITGSNGKSTVTVLVGEMARRAGLRVGIGGNLGPPALDLLDGPVPELYVLELSSFQLDVTESLNAEAAVVLNVSADHMDRHGDMAKYVAAKQRIYRGTGVVVINQDEPLLRDQDYSGRRTIRYGLGAPHGDGYGVREEGGRQWLARGEKRLLAVDDLRIKGPHNVSNALAALALGEALGLPLAPMLEVLTSFAGLPHRLQWVATHQGVSWYDDSKGTNVGATIAALHAVPAPVVLIAGGVGKGADFTLLRKVVAERALAVVLIGRDAPLIEAALDAAVPVHRAQDMRAAVMTAADLAPLGGSVLLSPACASFDMFADYRARGVAFVEAVREVTA